MSTAGGMRANAVVRGRHVVAWLAAAAMLVTLVAGSSPVPAAASPATDANYVAAVYHDFLGRAPSGAESQYVVAALQGGASRYGFVWNIANSDAYVSHLVTGFYRDTLDREPDPTGLAGWDHLIESGQMTIAQVGAAFYTSTEYFRATGQSDLRVWVTDLYERILHRQPDSRGLDSWVWIAATQGRQPVAYSIFQSTESGQDRVRKLYAALLDRGPDPVGLAGWTPVVLRDGDIRLAATLATSPEYYQRAQHQTPEGTWAEVSTPSTCDLRGLDDVGHLIGSCRDSSDRDQPAVWMSPSAEPSLLALPDDDNQGQATAVSPGGVIVGWGDAGFDEDGAPAALHLLLWASPTAPPAVLAAPTACGGTYVFPSAVNDSGIVVAACEDDASPYATKAYVWTSPAAQPVALSQPDDTTYVTPTAIGADGAIVGVCNSTQGICALGWASPSAAYTRLAVPSGYEDVVPDAVLGDGRVVGVADAPQGDKAPVTWPSQSGAPTVLSGPGGEAVDLLTGLAASSDGRLAAAYQVGEQSMALLSWASTTATPVRIDPPGGRTWIAPLGVNSQGLILASTNEFGTEPWIYRPAAGP